MKRVQDTLYDILDQYTGETVTYNKVTTFSDGTLMTDAKADGIIYRKVGSEYFKRNFTDSFSISRFSSPTQENLQKLINSFGGLPATILLDKTVQIISNITIPVNITLIFAAGATLNIDAGVLVTINSGLTAGNQQLFSGLGNVSIASDKINVRWFGALGNGITDDTIKIRLAEESLFSRSQNSRFGNLYFPSGVYIVNGLEKTHPRIAWMCESKGSAVIKSSNNSNKSTIKVKNTAFLGGIFNLTIDGNNENNISGNGLEFESTVGTIGYTPNIHRNKGILDSSNYTFTCIDNVTISKSAENGLRIFSSNYALLVSNLYIERCKGIGVYNESTDNVNFENIYIERCGLSGIRESGANNRWTNIKTIFNGYLDINSPRTSAGFNFTNSARITAVNIEAQDNYCDGFRFSNSKDINITNGLSDGNGYTSGVESGNVALENRFSSKLYVGYKFINSKGIKLINSVSTNYLGVQSDGFYVQDRNFIIDELSKDIDVSGLASRGFTNKEDIGEFNGNKTTDSSAISCIRNTSPTINSVNYAIDEPVLNSDGLTITTSDIIEYPINFKPKTSFSFITDFSINTGLTAIFPRIIASKNDNFEVVYVNDTTKFIQASVFINGNKRSSFLQLTGLGDIVSSLPESTLIRFSFSCNIVNNKACFLIAISFTKIDGSIYNQSSYSQVDISLGDKIDLIDNVNILNDGSSNINTKFTGIVQKMLFTTFNIEEFDCQIHKKLSKFKRNSFTYTDFTDYVPIRRNIVPIETLPAASAYYRDTVFSIKGTSSVKDKMYKCIKDTDNIYKWDTFSFLSDLTQYASLTAANVFTNTVNAVGFTLNRAAGSARDIIFQTSGSNRWRIRVNTIAESGSNLGSDLEFSSFTDAGIIKDTILSANRSTGVVNIPLLTSNTQAVTSNNINVATTAYVTSKVSEKSKLPVVSSKTTDYTVLSTDYLIPINAVSGNLNVFLPTAASVYTNNTGQIYTIKKVDSSDNIVLIAPSGTELIDNALTFTLYSFGDSVQIQSNGTNWIVLSKNIQIKNIVTTSNITLPSTNLYYTYTGTGGTVTLPSVANNSAIRVVIINGGAGDLTINSSAGAPDIMRDGMNESSITLMAGETANLINNSLKWVKI